MSDRLRTAKFRDRRLFSQNKYWIHFYSISSKIQGLDKKFDKNIIFNFRNDRYEKSFAEQITIKFIFLSLFTFTISATFNKSLQALYTRFLMQKNRRSLQIIKIELQLFGSRWNFLIKFLYFLGVYRLIICDLVLFVKPSKTSTTSLITSKLIWKDRIRI